MKYLSFGGRDVEAFMDVKDLIMSGKKTQTLRKHVDYKRCVCGTKKPSKGRLIPPHLAVHKEVNGALVIEHSSWYYTTRFEPGETIKLLYKSRCKKSCGNCIHYRKPTGDNKFLCKLGFTCFEEYPPSSPSVGPCQSWSNLLGYGKITEVFQVDLKPEYLDEILATYTPPFRGYDLAKEDCFKNWTDFSRFFSKSYKLPMVFDTFRWEYLGREIDE